ncbi:hypothetical protein SAMN05421810_10824 [Amycolatopsis arida]|uniref:DUF5709 domain-containing protein n=1 Tax=Amycolatopsis arida TaxID=587909 RepID=A0A1I5YWD6_9PSEU|nr:hypothetical protein [Amycolatopsis arida]TDX89937.1 hypothetical protein CLV69_10824 [Amycolatopsis arida]SFQ48522.1 hypothetical protein SAMN05421810_10824 [Amycolatopsis arida]
MDTGGEPRSEQQEELEYEDAVTGGEVDRPDRDRRPDVGVEDGVRFTDPQDPTPQVSRSPEARGLEQGDAVADDEGRSYASGPEQSALRVEEPSEEA